MHVLIPFDVVPKSRRVPYGVAPASERAVRYAVRMFGTHGNARITAVHLSTEDVDLPGAVGTSEIEAIRTGILGIVEESAVDAVVMGYEEKSFLDEVFHESTASRILENHGVPVTLVS